jgi:hypothetical protein
VSNFVHIELNTTDTEAAKTFYEGLFGWAYDSWPMPTGDSYWFVTGNASPGIALQRKPMAEGPTAWLPYVSVDSVRAAVDKARQLGAQVVVDYQPVADMGALAVLIDPTGAAFALWEDSDKSKSQRAAKEKEEAAAREREKKSLIERAVAAATKPLAAALEAAQKLQAARPAAAKKATKKKAKKKVAKKTKKAAGKKRSATKKATKKATKRKPAKKAKKAAKRKPAKKAKKAAKRKPAKKAKKKAARRR